MNEEQQQPDTPAEAAEESGTIESTPIQSTLIEPAQPLLGELLIAARERWNLSDADLARQMRLGLRQIQALEENRFDDLPGNTFVRGFIRNYARVVQCDPEPFLQAYEHSRPSQQRPEIEHSQEQIAFPNKALPKWVWYLGILLALALLSPLLIYLALNDDGAPQQAAKPPAAVVSPAANGAQIDAPLVLPPPQAVLQNAAPSAASGTQATEPNAPVTPPHEEAKTLPSEPISSGEASIALNFEGDAWVEVRDKSGKIVFSKLGRRGETQAVQGKSPFSLVVGNAVKVRIAYNGKPFDLAPHTKVNVARFKLE